MQNWFSIVPFIIAVAVAMLTRQVLVGLVLGLLVGSFFLQPGVANALSKMSDYILTSMSPMCQMNCPIGHTTSN